MDQEQDADEHLVHGGEHAANEKIQFHQVMQSIPPSKTGWCPFLVHAPAMLQASYVFVSSVDGLLLASFKLEQA
ncbi:hypothetical protein OROHE_025089 [Orobanche hederae]